MTAALPEVLTVEKSLLDQIAEETARVGARYMPTLTVKQFTEREKLLRELKEMLMEGVDYGVIPGTEKPTLLLPGAQKICTFFGYVPHYEVRQIEEWTPDKYGEPLFYYDYTCVLLKDRQGVGEGRGYSLSTRPRRAASTASRWHTGRRSAMLLKLGPRSRPSATKRAAVRWTAGRSTPRCTAFLMTASRT